MITCNLKGGLANMMFQVAGISVLAYKNNSDVYYHNIKKHMHDLNNWSCNKGIAEEYYKVFPNFDLRTNLNFGFTPTRTITVPFEYVELLFEDGACYDGFFQSEKYFVSHKEYVKNLFVFNDVILEKAITIVPPSDAITCAIHVRRGDYLNYPNIHPVQSIDYYNAAMDHINADHYYIFSDDINWCAQNFTATNITFVSGNRDYVDMAAMQLCDHSIISNSSFSWWPAWLRDSGKVVAPIKWFGKDAPVTALDIIPDIWIKL